MAPFIFLGVDTMKKVIAFILVLLCLCCYARAEEWPATPTDLVEFDDDDQGEVTITFQREVYIDEPLNPVYIGDTVTLTAILVNFKDDDVIRFYWQYAMNLPDWLFIDGENEQTYTFILTEENYNYWYRVLVGLEVEE